MAASLRLLSRKRDLIYLLFFCIHIPVLLSVDTYPIWASSTGVFSWMTDLRQFYVKTYKDRLFVEPPAFFSLYIWLELLYHLPLSIYAITALLRDDPKLPLHLLIYAVQTGLTTATCISEALSWNTLNVQEKLSLVGGLYTPYLLVSVFMGLDMWARLSASIESKQRGKEMKKRS